MLCAIYRCCVLILFSSSVFFLVASVLLLIDNFQLCWFQPNSMSDSFGLSQYCLLENVIPLLYRISDLRACIHWESPTHGACRFIFIFILFLVIKVWDLFPVVFSSTRSLAIERRSLILTDTLLCPLPPRLMGKAGATRHWNNLEANHLTLCKVMQMI